jgi:hypothetical protein
MSEESSLEITLAGKPFIVRPFTFDQVENLHVLGIDFEAFQNEEETRKYYSRCANIIAEALSVDHPEMKVETLRKMRIGTFPEVRETVHEILIFSGIWKRVAPSDTKQEPSTGEASAAP